MCVSVLCALSGRLRPRGGDEGPACCGMACNGVARSRFEMFSNGGDEAAINRKLPKELLLRIFSFLDVVTLCRCAQVSRAWNVLALDGSNWQKIDLFNFQRDIEGRVVENISKSDGCKGLEHLNVSWCDQVTEDGITALARECHSMKVLLLKGCYMVNDVSLKQIGKYCPELVTLNLQNCSRVTDDGVITVCRGCHKLQSLSVSGCNALTDALLSALGHNCCHLRILEVAGCSQLSDTGFQMLARNCHDLEKMDLEECIQITDATLIQLSLQCPRLQVLSLSHCELITDDGIRHLGNGACSHERLTVLELDNCPLVTDASLEHLKGCQSLQRVELYDCQQITRAGIKRLRAHLPEIKVHAYFAPSTPPQVAPGPRARFCRCCVIL